jgi:hypothetical protein
MIHFLLLQQVNIYCKKDNVDHLTWHENLGFYKLRWAFDVAIAFIYNTFGFAGIYAFVVLIACLTAFSLFNILLKQKNLKIMNIEIIIYGEIK